MRLVLTCGAACALLLALPAFAQDEPEEVPVAEDDVEDVQDILDEDLDQEVEEGEGDEPGPEATPPAKENMPWKPFGGTQGGGVDWDASFSEEVGTVPAVFTPSRQPEEPFHTSVAVDLVTEDELEAAQAVTTTPALLDLPGVFTIQPTAAGVSPALRGLHGQRVSLLFDGIRLHHATVPAGPSLLAGLVDPMSLAALEVIRGPSLVMAGPFAVGGAVNFMPALPTVNPLVSFRTDASAFYHYGSTDTSHVLHGEVDLQLYETALSTRMSYGTFGALQSGSDRQPYTEYRSASFDFAVRRALGIGSDLLFYYGLVKMDQAYMPLMGLDPGGKDYMRWPQLDRHLVYMRLSSTDAGPLESLQLTIGMHIFDELPQHYSENTDLTPTLSIWEKQNLHTTSAFALLWNRAPLGNWGSLLTGVDYYMDLVDSRGKIVRYQGPTTLDVETLSRPVLPNGAMSHSVEPHAVMDIFAMQPFMLSLGGRFWYHDLDPGGGLETRHLLGGSGFLSGRLPVADLVAFVLNVTYGTRPPTMFEYAGQSSAPFSQMPSPEGDPVEPEGVFGAEFGTKWDLGVLEGSLFYGFTLINDLIVPILPAGGSAWVWANAGRGWIHALEFRNHVNIGRAWTIGAILSWQHGTRKFDSTEGEKKWAIDMVPPLMGTAFVTVRYPRQYIWGDVRLRWAIKQSHLGPGETLASSEKDPFFLLSLRGGLDLGEHLRLYVSFENLVGETYRWHGSFIDGPGRSVYVGIEGHL